MHSDWLMIKESHRQPMKCDQRNFHMIVTHKHLFLVMTIYSKLLLKSCDCLH